MSLVPRPLRAVRRCVTRIVVLAVLVVVVGAATGRLTHLGPLDLRDLTPATVTDAVRDALGTGDDGDGRPGTAADPDGCRVVDRVVPVGLSSTRYPQVRAHWEAAIARGRPRVLTVHRRGAADRRDRLLRGIQTRPGLDRDEYPMAMARTTVSADVAYVDAAQNRGSGSVQGTKLRRYCSGQRFRIVWY